MDKEINNNDYDYVDLGLPSGTKWAAQNVGARKPSDYGLYFQWGDTVGYTADQIGTGEGKKAFTLADYKWYLSGSIEDDNIAFKKYTTTGATLELEDDAAHTNMGESWHMPTPTQIQELLDNTTTAWTTSDSVSGMTFTSKKDGSKSVFVPAAGGAEDGLVSYSGDIGIVWSSVLNARNVDKGQALIFDSDGAILLSYFSIPRYDGVPVRGVIG